MKKIFTELFEQFVKTNKREPKGMELIQLKFKANKLQREADKIIEFPRDKIQPLDPDDALPNYTETPGEYSRRNTPGSIENLREEMKIAYRKEFDRLTGNETAEELTEMLKNLDTDGVPFAKGGPVDFENWKKGKDQFEKEQSKEELYREYLEQMRRKKIYDTRENVAEGGRPTSTGLNYLLGEDDTNSRVPYAAGGRRGFLKLLAGLGAAGAAFKTGLLSLGKGAAKPAAKVAAEAATSGAPPHFLQLVAKIKALGDDATSKYATKDREVVTKYKDFELTEDITTGRTTIQRYKQSEVDYYDEMLMEETYMDYIPGKNLADETTKGKNIPDEYTEDTSYLRTSGPQKGDIVDTVDGVPDDVLKEVEAGSGNVPESFYTGPNAIKKADGGRMGYAGGKKVVEGLISLLNKKAGKDVLTTADKIAIPKKTLDRDMFKKTNDRLNDKRTMNADELEDFEMEIGDALEGYDFDGTIGDAKRILKEDKAYEAEMLEEYMSIGGSKRPGGPKDAMADAIENASPGYTGDLKYDANILADDLAEKRFGKEFYDLDVYQQSSLYDEAYKALAENKRTFKEMQNLSKPNKTLEGIKKTGTIDISDPDIADEFARFMKEKDPKGYKDMEQKIELESFDPKKTKGNAEGGRIGLLSGGGVLKKLIMNLAKEKGMSGSEVLKVMNYKSLPSKIKNLMTKEEFTSMKDQRLEGVEIWRDLMASQQEMTKNIDAGKNTPAAELFEMLEKTSPGYGTVPRNISDADMLQMEQMIKNMKTKDNRQLNAKGGLANLLGE